MTLTVGAEAEDVATGRATRSPRPPALDLGLLARAFARSLPAAVGIGLVVGILVALGFSGVQSTYTVSTMVSVGTASRAEKDASAMTALAAGMSEFVMAARARELVEQRTGETVVLSGRNPTVEVTTAKIPGFLQVVTRSHRGSSSARQMGIAVVEAMNMRAGELREEFLAPAVEAAQVEIDGLNEQILARQESATTVDTSDLRRLVYEARARTEVLRSAYPTASIIAQDDADGQRSWPRPLETGTVACLVVTLLAAAALAGARIRRSRRTDRIWARAVGHRYDSVVDIDVAALNVLPPMTDAAVSAVLSAGGTVVILGQVDPVKPALADGADGHRLLVTDYETPWWREIPAAAVDLGVVVVDLDAPKSRAAEAGLAGFAVVGVPTRVVVREPEPLR